MTIFIDLSFPTENTVLETQGAHANFYQVFQSMGAFAEVGEKKDKHTVPSVANSYVG